MAENDSEWYFGSRLSVNEGSSTPTEKSSSDVYHYNNEDSDSTYELSTQIVCARSSSSSLDSDFSDEESCSSSEESIIDLEKLKREQIRLMLKKISKNGPTEGKKPEKV